MTRMCLVSDRQRPLSRCLRPGLRTSLATIAAIAGGLLLAATPASAQPAAHGFSLDRFEPSAGGSDWFVLESLDFRGNGRPSLGVVGEWAWKPLVLYNRSDEEVATVVDQQ